MDNQKLNKLIAEQIPNGWISETDTQGTISIYDPNTGVGAVQITIYDHHVGDENPSEIFNNHLKSIYPNSANSGSYFETTDVEGIYWRYWILEVENRFLFITYNCDQADKNNEESIVNFFISYLCR